MRRPFAERWPKADRTDARGFSLLEVLVSLAILAIAVTLLLQLFSTDLRAIVRSGDMTSAAMKGDSRIRELLAEPGLAEKSWSEATEDGYRLDIVVQEALPERTDNLPVKLLEVVVTVRWREGMQEKSLRIETLKMVDKIAPAGAASPAAA